MATPAVERRIDEWKQKLIDPSRRNRLIYFRPSKSATLTISTPDAETIFNRLVVQEKPWKFWMPPAEREKKEEGQDDFFSDEQQESPAASQARRAPKQDELVCGGVTRTILERTLKNIFRKAHTDYQERGVRILYLAFGTLVWRDKDKSDEIRSPLILCPVDLGRESARDPYALALAEEDPVLNPALQAKLLHDFKLKLPEIPEDWEETPLSKYLESLARKVRPLEWKVEPTAVLGLFSFHKLVMYQDLLANAGHIRGHQVIRSLTGEQIANSDAAGGVVDERELDSVQKPEETYQILDADSSQQQCIQAALQGYNLVLQGPPGTGKSQTIANIIAEFIARGRTVLFVSEKMAALEVVSKRLSDVHLGEFALELHSHKANKREVVAELKQCLDEQLIPKNLPTPSDFEKLKRLRQALNDYVLGLHAVREPMGESVRDVLGRLAALDDVPLLPTKLAHVEELRPQRVAEWQELVKRLSTVWHVIAEGEDFPWYMCRDTTFTLETRSKWAHILGELIASLEGLKDAAERYAETLGVETPLYLEDITWLTEVGVHLNRSPGADATWLTSPGLDELFDEAERYQELGEHYLSVREGLRQSYSDAFFDLPAGLADRLKQAWEGTSALLAPDDSRGRLLIDSGRKLLAFAESTRLTSIEWQRDVGELLREFELPAGPVNLERAQAIAGLGLLCVADIKPEAAWLEPRRHLEVQDVVRRARPEYEDYRTKRGELLRQCDESLFTLDLDHLIDSVNKVTQHPNRSSLGELTGLVGNVLSTRLDKSGDLSRLSALLKDLNESVAEAGRLLGLPTDHVTIERAQEIGRLAELCGTNARPEVGWLDPARLQQVQHTIKKLRPEYEGYNNARAELLGRFDESLFELDIDRLIESFGSFLYRPPLSWVNPSYYRDKKAVLRTSRSGAPPTSIVENLLKAREVLRTRKRLEPEMAQARALLERYDQGFETDFGLAGRASDVAEEVLKLSGGASLPEALVKAITYGTVASPQIPAAGKRVLDVVRQWEDFASRFPDVIHLDDLVKAREAVYRRQWLDGSRDEVKLVLGKFDNAYDTDFEVVDRALRVAADAIQLARHQPLPGGLVRLITQPATIAPDLASSGSHIIETVHAWEESAVTVSGFLPEALTGTSLPLAQSPLSDIEGWAQSLGTHMTEVRDLTDLVLSHHKAAGTADLSTIHDDLRKNEELIAMRSHIDSEAERLRRVYGVRFSGINTEWKDVLSAIGWTRKMREIFGRHEMSETFVRWATMPGNQTPQVTDLNSVRAGFDEKISALESGFESPEPTYQGAPLRDHSLGKMLARIYEIRERLDELQPWTDFKRFEGQFEGAGLTGFLTQLRKNPPPPERLLPIFNKSVYQAWVTAVFERDEKLSEFRGSHHEQLIEEFKEIDRKLVRLASQRIVAECTARRPKSVYLQAQDSEIGILRKEAAKKRKHLPLRHLFDRIPNLLLKLKPCLFMSPLSVSQFLPPEKFKFDLVIFDEASQIFTEDAIGAIYRGSQLVVAGDSKQLPPTDFFKSIDSDGDDAEDGFLEDETSADFNSVLDECESTSGMSVYSLRWHYRSRHESLIAFSNHRFYHSRLITFPSAQHKHKALGVELVHLPDGVYDRGGKRINLREAEAVADRVFEHFAHYPGKSIGVVAFSQAQMAAIEDEIERRRKTNTAFEHFFKEDRLEGFFVKNLENVQGDERDVIIFSIGYGRDQHGRMTMSFGPLNRNGGERRLNVAVTRAREKVVLVSSIIAADIDLSATQSAGVLNLYHYLDYAARGDEALQLSSPQGVGEADSPFEEDVAGEIRALGYEVVPQVGCSGFRIDLGVIDPAEPGRFLLGVECDGATYHSAATARDRDRLRQQILEQLGWRIHRIWSPDWVQKREGEVRRLKQAIEDARLGGRSGDELTALLPDEEDSDSEPPAPEMERVAVSQPDEGSPLPGTIPYEVCDTNYVYYNGNEFHYPQYREEQCEMLARIVTKEGPIHLDLATRRLLSAWGLTRAGVRITEAVAEAVRKCERKSLLKKRGEFLWPAVNTEVPVRVPVSYRQETYRDVAHIPSEEIQACMLLIIRHALGIGVDSLIKETANVFGFNRTGDRIRDRLIKECRALHRQGVVVNIDGSLSLAVNGA